MVLSSCHPTHDKVLQQDKTIGVLEFKLEKPRTLFQNKNWQNIHKKKK